MTENVDRRMDRKEELLTLTNELIAKAGGSPETFQGELIGQMIQNCLKLITDNDTISQLKLMNRAFKEMRYAYKVFSKYSIPGKRLSIFGSARTPETHPDYLSAKAFSSIMDRKGWMCITGAANGIMKAGHEGTKKESSFGLSIRLSLEPNANEIIEGDPKLINFRYFFTRKLMFISHSDACAVFPGGVGTLDELYEILTLMQTGKSSIIPVVMMEGQGGNYWQDWHSYFNQNLLANGWVSPEDRNFFFLASSEEEGAQHIEQFYSRYHSMRFLKDDLIIRIKSPLTPEQIDLLNDKFSVLVKSGKIRQDKPFPEENEYLEYPRLIFHFTRKNFGLLRSLIDQVNQF